MNRAAGRKSSAQIPSRPIITITTDFGLVDSYVAAMKAVLIRHCDRARLIDVTHCISRHDILSGSIALERAVNGFPPGTVHLAVVDPGVGSDRRLLIAEINRQWIVCPDNGLITWSWRNHPRGKTYEISWRPAKISSTFHGRDILSPVAARLAGGEKISTFARPIDDPIVLDISPAAANDRSATIIHIDYFGNATTNLASENIALHRQVIRVNGRTLGKIRKTYSDVPPGKPLVLIGSSGLLEIAIRDGSAAQELRLRVGDTVTIR